MTFLAPLETTVSVAVEALSDQQLLALASETAATELGFVARDTLPSRVAEELRELLDDVRNDRVEAALVEDDPEQAPQARLQGLRERLRRAGRSLLVGHVVQPGPYGDESVLVIAMPMGVLRRAEVACSLEAA